MRHMRCNLILEAKHEFRYAKLALVRSFIYSQIAYFPSINAMIDF